MPYKRYMCLICGYIYEEKLGWPNEGIAPGTLWQDVPEAWCCPDCGVGKEAFMMLEIA